MKKYHFLPMSLLTVAVLAACSSLPPNNVLLDEAGNDYSKAKANPQVTDLAATELKQAGDSLDKATNAWKEREDRALIEHLAHVAKQQVAIAQETASQKAAELAVTTASAERDQVRLEARTREADLAQRSAESSRQESEASQRKAEASQLQSEASQRSAEASQRQAVTEKQAASDAHLNTQVARQQTQDAENRSRQLEAQLNESEAQLKDMEAKKTDRGMVITLGEVVFDTNKAQLKSGGIRNVQKLADFLKQYPQRKIMIEGFTDSSGSDSHNQSLSDKRASSVRTALLDMGISPDRLTSRGYGEAFPVANNNTAAGRQMNRRVEIIVSDNSGNITPR